MVIASNTSDKSQSLGAVSDWEAEDKGSRFHQNP